jgi:hypothetical protein
VRQRGGVEAGMRPLVARARRWRAAEARGRELRQRAPAVLALHERDDGQAEGHPAHDRRLPDRRVLHDADGVPSAG